ncbi:GNAT family N-acetyltransferase [Nitrospira sp. Nam80]
MSREFSVRVIGSVDEFSRLASEWTDLLHRSGPHGIFLTWEWLYRWARRFLGGNRLWILIVVDDGDHVRGIAPFYIRSVRFDSVARYREIAFLGTEEVCSSYLDIIAEPTDKQMVWRRLYRFLFQEAANAWDVLTLEEIPAESSSVDILRECFEAAGKVIDMTRSTCCPILHLPRSCVEYRRTLSANRRYNLQRKQKALQRLGPVSYRHIQNGPELSQAFDAIIALHETKWMSAGRGGGAFSRERFRAFNYDIVSSFENTGWLSLSLLTLDDRPIAGIYGFIYEGTYYFYLPGCDPTAAPHASPGMLLLAHRIEQAIEEGDDHFDFLQGRADYKERWADDIRRSVTMRAYNRHGRALLLKVIESAKQAVKILVR